MAKLAIIGGTGVYEAGILAGVEQRTLVTPYGTVDLQSGTMRGPSGRESEVIFLTRHGREHSVPPHRVNYRANVWALWALGVQRVIGTGAVGSLKLEMRPGDCVLVDQFLDFTHGRAATFFDGEGAAPGVGPGAGHGVGPGVAPGVGPGVAPGAIPGPEQGGSVVHTDMTEPYCPELRQALRGAAAAAGVTVHDGGCYACTQGPRFETAAEIRMFRAMGADVVGMTNVPEVVLARELGLCYALVAMVTNYAAGITGQPLTHAEVVETMRENVRKIRALAWRALDEVSGERQCGCGVAPGGPPRKA